MPSTSGFLRGGQRTRVLGWGGSCPTCFASAGRTPGLREVRIKCLISHQSKGVKLQLENAFGTTSNSEMKKRSAQPWLKPEQKTSEDDGILRASAVSRESFPISGRKKQQVSSACDIARFHVTLRTLEATTSYLGIPRFYCFLICPCFD